MDLGKFGNQWFALQVKTRREHICAHMLRSKGYEEFLPLCRPRVGEGASRALGSAQFPLFPGYLFCRLVGRACGPILTTPGVIRLVGYGGVPSPIGQDQITNIRRLVDSGHPSCAWSYIPAGQRVRITAGPLCGVTGTLLRAKNIHRLIVSIDLLQRSAAVELPAECISCDQTVGGFAPRPEASHATDVVTCSVQSTAANA